MQLVVVRVALEMVDGLLPVRRENVFVRSGQTLVDLSKAKKSASANNKIAVG